MSSSRAAVRDPSDPSAKHFCQPTRARPVGIGAERRRRSGGRRAIAVVERVVADARVDAERQAPGLGEARVGREREGRGPGPGRAPPGSWHGDDAERDAARRPTVAMAASRSAWLGAAA